jgi:hypothetical protein
MLDTPCMRELSVAEQRYPAVFEAIAKGGRTAEASPSGN